jgi:putative transposase
MEARKPYATDLTNAQWAKIEHLVPAPKTGGRPAKYTRREILNALFYMARSGCSWRLLPHDFPSWRIVYWYFGIWRDAGLFEQINSVLRKEVRIQAGKDPEPSAAIMDSQSVKTTEKGGPANRHSLTLQALRPLRELMLERG